MLNITTVTVNILQHQAVFKTQQFFQQASKSPKMVLYYGTRIATASNTHAVKKRRTTHVVFTFLIEVL